MTESNSILRTFEEHDRTVYVHAYRSVMNDWRLGLTIVAAHDGERTTTRLLTRGTDKGFVSAAAAARAGLRLARGK